jgi:dTDP-4-amino-4,6-dideoxygalactose transaminase
LKDNFLVFGQPLIEQAEIDEVVDSLKKSWLGSGPKVEKFERAFAVYKGVSNAVALNSCTAGLHLSCLALNLKEGDEVITTAMTFCATVNAIIHSGATPVLADIDKDTWNIDSEDIERKITPKTKAIIVVHFAGRMCEMDKIKYLADKHDLYLIEDCAHAIESEYKGQKAGTFGNLGVFSFYATKNVVTGEGGMVISKNDNHLSKIKTMALHGMSKDAWKRFSDEGFKHYFVQDAGFKYNMMDIQAAIGIHQLERVEKNSVIRKRIWNLYMKELREVPVGLPAPIEPDSRHAYHLFNITINKDRCGISRDEFLTKITEHNIGVGVHYLSIPQHPYYSVTFDWRIEDYPNSYKYGMETVSLPISPKLSDEIVYKVIESVKKIIK